MMAVTKRRGKATTKKGITYRSLLESRWAAWFSKQGWQVEYEPHRLFYHGGSYLPDFRWVNPVVQGMNSDTPLLLDLQRVYIEVKPTMLIATHEIEKAYPALPQMDALLLLTSDPPTDAHPRKVEVIANGFTWVDDIGKRGYYYHNTTVGSNLKVGFVLINSSRYKGSLVWILQNK